jgi:hypothetical protein
LKAEFGMGKVEFGMGKGKEAQLGVNGYLLFFIRV